MVQQGKAKSILNGWRRACALFFFIYATASISALISFGTAHANVADDWNAILFKDTDFLLSVNSCGSIVEEAVMSCESNAGAVAQTAHECVRQIFDMRTQYFRPELGLDSYNCLVPTTNDTFYEQDYLVARIPRCCLTSFGSSCMIRCEYWFSYFSTSLSLPVSPKNSGLPSCPRSLAGNPINTGTGNKFQIETDFVGGPNTYLALARYYNSRDFINTGFDVDTDTGFGVGWRSTYNRSLTQISTFIVKVTRADGRVDVFYKESTSGTWKSDADVTAQLIAVVDSSNNQIGWKLITDDDNTELYNTNGQLTYITTRAGLAITLSYNSNNRLITVTGPFGHTLNFSYDSNGHLTQMALPDSNVISYSYDSNSNLTSVTYPENVVRTYHYENTSFHNALTGITDENGNRFATYLYDSQGRATSTEHANGAQKTTVAYNTDGTSSVTDANGNSHEYSFLTQYDLVKPTAVSNAGCGCGSSAYTYDDNGFLASRTDFNGNVTTYTHDTRGLETSRTEAYGSSQVRTITTEWDATYRLPSKITEPNRTTAFSYDSSGNLLTKTVTADDRTRTWTYTYNSNGQVLTVDGPRTDVSDVTTYGYDGSGNLASITDALGHVTSITSYDANGRPLSIMDPNGLVTTLAYDARGRLTSRVSGNESTIYTYDNAGQLTQIILPDGSYLAYSYDQAHRLTGIADGVGNSIAYTLDAMGNRTKEQVYDPSNTLAQTRSHAYDELNRLSQDIGAQNQTTSYGYDSNGNLTSITDPLNHATSNAYDSLNRLIQVTNPNNGVTGFGYDSNDKVTSATDPLGLVTSYAYDGLSNLTSIQSPDTGTTAKTYDAAGNVASSTDARGQTTTYAYDALNRPTKATVADGSSITWQYDQGTNGVGRLTTMIDPSGSTAWNYGSHGRMTQKQQQTGSVTLTTSMTYDSSGRLASVTYPSGRQLTYSYDSNGQISGINVDGTSLVSSVAYKPFGLVAGWIQGQSGSLAYSRDFDQDGRIAGITVKGSGSDNTIDLTYDDASRITSITDNKGSRPDMTAESISYSYSSTSNRLVGGTGKTSQSYTYDAAGNLIGDGTNTFSCDARGRLTQVTVGGVTTTYAINGLGQRVTKSGASTTYFVYDEAGHLIGEYDASGNIIQETVWLGELAVGVLTSGAQYYVNPDHLGAPQSIRDQSGNVLWRWDHDPFGNGAPSGSITCNLRFPGQYYDSETGLFYNYYRDYNPATGRYVQSDPIGLAGGVNTYAYVDGNPVGRVDPYGLAEINWNNRTGGRNPFSLFPPTGPTYGNWGGGLWSGGQYSPIPGQMGTAQPVDSLDEVCKSHDKCYAMPVSSILEPFKKDLCNRQLVNNTEALSNDPRNWAHPPQPGTEMWARIYRGGVIVWFREDTLTTVANSQRILVLILNQLATHDLK